MAMTLKDIMSTNVMTVTPDATLQAAAELMRDGDIGMLPVGDQGRLVGSITDRDICIRAVARGKDPTTARVKEAMTEDLLFAFDDDDIDRAADLMAERQVRRLPILSREERLVGIVSLGDVAVRVQRDAPADQALTGISQD